jgi:hypothetical protein
MLGAQYLHKKIQDLPISRPTKLSYMLNGTVDNYRDKVYGDIEALEDVTVSPELFVGYHESWSLREAYELLWSQWSNLIVDCTIDQEMLLRIHPTFDKIISTIPAPSICYQRDRHIFEHVKVLIDSYWHGPSPMGGNLVVCNGFPYNPGNLDATGWYRTSVIFGQSNTEWSPHVIKRADAHLVIKPIKSNCNCWPGIIRSGRYGQWLKGVLSHESFDLMLEVLA